MVERLICPFCGRDDFKSKKGFTKHVNYCKENPDRVEVSSETRRKLSEYNKCKTLSEEHKQKISEAAKRRTYSEETRKKMSVAQKIAQNRLEVRQKQSEAHKRPDVRQKEYETKKKNNSFNTSKIEEQLKEYFTSHNINFKTQYKSDVYPFMCDFYFPDKDLYVEIQGTWTHGKRPFDANDLDCINKLELWKSKNTDFYNNAIDTWTNRDVRKRNCAKEHNLNWIEIFSDDFETCIKIIYNNI